MNKEYIITVFSENKVGLLSQITTVFTCRDINIESLTTSESSIPGIHKFTIVVITDPEKIEKLVKQIEKKIDVLKAFVFTPDEVVQQEIALYKVTRSNSVEKLVRDHSRKGTSENELLLLCLPSPTLPGSFQSCSPAHRRGLR